MYQLRWHKTFSWYHHFKYVVIFVARIRKTLSLARLRRVDLASKVKQSHYTPCRRLWGEERYSACLFLTSALDGDEWSASRPIRPLPPGKAPPVPIGQEAGWASEVVWTQRLEKKSFCLCRESNADPPIVQSVVRHCTDWTTQPTDLASSVA
jgi:hypothetical protein